MAISLLSTNTDTYDQNTYDVINDLKKKNKCADIESIHNKVTKMADFNDITKDDLKDRMNILVINDKLMKKLNRNLDSN